MRTRTARKVVEIGAEACSSTTTLSSQKMRAISGTRPSTRIQSRGSGVSLLSTAYCAPTRAGNRRFEFLDTTGLEYQDEIQAMRDLLQQRMKKTGDPALAAFGKLDDPAALEEFMETQRIRAKR